MQMFGLRSGLDRIISRIWFAFFRLRDQEAQWGTDLTLHGIPILHFAHGSHVHVGHHTTLTSTARENLAGLTKKCSFYVGRSGSLSIGSNCGFSGVSIYCSESINIGDYLTCGANVNIWDTDFHPLNYLERRMHNEAGIKTAPVTIGNDVFIGANTIILKGVTIGSGAVVAAGSVVSKSIPPGEVWGGNPAARIR
jgi:acetyltransferase-like isoleucine patch superfamily enzyme